MTDVFLVRHDIEPGRTDDALALFERMAALDSEAVDSVLQREGVYTESAFVERDETGDSILYYIEAADGERVYDVFQEIHANPDDELDAVATSVKELTAVMDGEPYLAAKFETLYHFVGPERRS